MRADPRVWRPLLLIVALAGLLTQSWAEAGSVVGLGACSLVPNECTPPPPNSGFVSVSTGNYHGMGLRPDGSIATWGLCDVGQCTVPSPNSGFIAISAGDSHSLALRPDGSIKAWGSNEAGELQVPVPNAGFVAIAAGLLHNLALKADGSIVGWGSNIGGEITPPAPNNGWVAMDAGGYYSIGLKSDGSIRRWGCNGPCPVPSPNTGFVAVSTHFYANRGFAHALRSEKPGEAGVSPPLTVRRQVGQLVIDWGASGCGSPDYAVYRGDLTTLASGSYSHNTALGCAQTGTTFSVSDADPRLGHADYFLAVASDGTAEGSYGQATGPIERPASEAACRVVQDLGSCP